MDSRAPRSIEEIQETHIDTYRSNPDRIGSDAGTERQDWADADNRFIFELLQNAVDEMDRTAEPRVRIESTNESLLVANNGTPFTINDLYALTLTTRTTKAGETTIGHKGRGFTSVLGITDRPAVYAESVKAQFDRQETTELLNEDPTVRSQTDSILSPTDVPLLCLPFSTDAPPKVQELLADGFTTVFELPLRDSQQQGAIERKLKALGANTIALLPQLDEIEIFCPDWERTWIFERSQMTGQGTPTLVELQSTTKDGAEQITEVQSYVIFERNEIDQAAVAEQADLTTAEIEAMGELSVSIGFRAEQVASESSLAPSDWSISPVYGGNTQQSPYIHVFLPTQERSPIPSLVSGTFQSDTSRRNLTIDYDDEQGYENQFNALLFAKLGQLLSTDVISFVDASATTLSQFLATLDPSLGGEREWSFTPGSIQHCLFESVRSSLCDVAFVPGSHGADLISIDDLVVTHTAPDTPELGREFVDIIGTSQIEICETTKYLPTVSLLSHQTATTLRALGAARLSPSDIPTVIGQSSHEPVLQECRNNSPDAVDESGDESCVLWIDPVLVHLVEVRKTLESDEQRDAFDEACRAAPVFPTEAYERTDGTKYANRQPHDQQPLFVPPETQLGNDTLPTLSFLPRELYHGTDPNTAPQLREKFLPAAFRSELENIWNLESFSFERVFDIGIRPSIPGPNSQDADVSFLESASTLETIRKLAAVQSPENDRDPDDPLLYRSSRRSFFELSKLPVPAVPLEGPAQIEWQPAHRVYFGLQWQTGLGRDEQSHIEPLLAAVGDQVESERFDPWFLAPPAWFGINEDDEKLRQWAAFLKWLGVADHVRPLPLFAPDAATSHRYRDTEGLSRPSRSAITARDELKATEGTETPVDARYSGLTEDDWETYKTHLVEHVAPEIQTESHRYLFQVNPLEYAEEILAAAAGEERIGQQLWAHLSAWWDDALAKHQHAIVAEFTNERWRGSNRSYFFSSGELNGFGTNLWLWQLQQCEWMPTDLKTVSPPDAWALSDSDRERFSLTLDGQHPLLPFVDIPLSTEGATQGRDSQSLANALDIGTSLEKNVYSPTDTQCVLDRIATLLQNPSVDTAQFAGEIELLYTRVSELLPGLKAEQISSDAWLPTKTGLGDVKVLCRTGDSYQFLPANEAYFVRSHSARERYATLELPLLVLFKPEAPRFGAYLGATDISDVVTQTPGHGTELDFPIEIDGITHTRKWFETVLAGLVLRLRADRPSTAAVDQDTSNTQRFLSQLELVDGLDIEISTSEPEAQFDRDTLPRSYYIQREAGQKERVLLNVTFPGASFVDAFARAYTEYLDVPQYYEAIYNLVDNAFGAPEPHGKLLDRLHMIGSGARAEQLTGTRQRLFDPDASIEIDLEEEPSDDTPARTNGRTDPEIPRASSEQGQTATNGSGSAARSNRVPALDSLKRIGKRQVFEIETKGSDTAANGSGGQSTSSIQNQPQSTTSVSPASQEYRSQIDAFGMTVAMKSEHARLRMNGEDHPERNVWNVSTPETFERAKLESNVKQAIENFTTEVGITPDANPFETDWPGFDVLTIVTDDDGDPAIDRCIELKTSGLRTRKPSLSWNEWKAAGSKLGDHYYLYVAREIRKGKSGEATLLEIPRPFQTLTNHRRERREREVQLDLRSFDLDDDSIIEQTIEWDE